MNAKSIHEKTPLLHSLRYVSDLDVDRLKLLLRYQANINVRDRDGRTPLMISIVRSNKDLAKLLLANGAQIDVQDQDGATALMITMDRLVRSSEREASARLLLESGANVNLQNKRLESALALASEACETGIVRLL